MFSSLRNYLSGRNYDHSDYASQQSWPTRHKVTNWLSGIHKSRNKDPYWKHYEDDKRYYANHQRDHAPSNYHQRDHVPSNYQHQNQQGSRRQRHNSMPNMRATNFPPIPMKDERARQSSMYGNHHQPMYPYQQRSHNEYPIMPQHRSKNYGHEPSQYMNQFQSPLRQYNHNNQYNHSSHQNYPDRYNSIGVGNYNANPYSNQYSNQYSGQMNPYQNHPMQHHNYNNNGYQRQRYPSNYM